MEMQNSSQKGVESDAPFWIIYQQMQNYLQTIHNLFSVVPDVTIFFCDLNKV